MRTLGRGVVLGVVVAMFAGLHASASVDVDFGGTIALGDRGDLYFAISSRYFDRDRAYVRQASATFEHPDDLAVALYLSARSGRSMDEVRRLRRQGLTWFQISVRFGLPADIWFVEVEREPGPPYGRAYGYWRNHGRDRTTRIVLTDQEVRDLFAVRMIHEYYGVSVEVAMDWRASGRDLRTILCDEYGRRHHGDDHDGQERGHGSSEWERSAGRGNGQGHGRGHDR